MSIRAVICDIYQTLLAVGPPPADAGARWSSLWEACLGLQPRLSLEQFTAEATAAIAREHTAARAVGIPFPEILWPETAGEVLPELKRLSSDQLAEFLWGQMELMRTVRLLPSAADGLRMLSARGIL